MSTSDSLSREMEKRITEAVRCRRSYFRKQSNSLTFEGVRRLLEMDMGVETLTLDAHKKLIKKLLQENFYSSEDEGASGNEKEDQNDAENSELENRDVEAEDHGTVKNADNELLKEQNENQSSREQPDKDDKDQVHPKKADNGNNDGNNSSQEVTETVIKEAFSKRAAYIRAEINSISLGGVRRLLEQDLQLEKKTLDAHKSLISKLVDEVINPPDKPDDVREKKHQKKSSDGKTNDFEEDEVEEKKCDTMEDSFVSAEISREDEEIEQNRGILKDSKSKKGRMKDSMTLKRGKKRKESESETKKSVKKPKKKKEVEDEDAKPLKSESRKRKEDDSADELEQTVKTRISEESDSSLADNEVKMQRKNINTPVVVHGEQVQHLKKIIKACGMTVPPIVYKKAKQQPESKQESYLMQEMMAILKREGLSSNPTDKEIRAVKRRKEKAKDLEGIDTTNIISDSRSRRAKSNFFAPPPEYNVLNEDSSDEENSQSSGDDEPVIEDEESD